MKTTEYNNDLLAQLRDEAGLSQTELGEALGVTRMMVYLAETSSCSIHLLKKYAAHFQRPLMDLYRESALREIPEKTLAQL